jgi:hypothetical protein
MESPLKFLKIHLKTSQMDFEVNNEWRKELPCTVYSKQISEEIPNSFLVSNIISIFFNKTYLQFIVFIVVYII